MKIGTNRFRAKRQSAMSVLPCSQAFQKQFQNAFGALGDYGAGAEDGAGAVLEEVVVVLGGEGGDEVDHAFVEGGL